MLPVSLSRFLRMGTNKCTLPILTIMFKNILRTFEAKIHEIIKKHSASAYKKGVSVPFWFVCLEHWSADDTLRKIQGSCTDNSLRIAFRRCQVFRNSFR